MQHHSHATPGGRAAGEVDMAENKSEESHVCSITAMPHLVGGQQALVDLADGLVGRGLLDEGAAQLEVVVHEHLQD